MTPDPCLARALKELNPRLSLRWNNQIERWEVWEDEVTVEPVGAFNGGVLSSVMRRPYRVTIWQEPITQRFMSADWRIVSMMERLEGIRNNDPWAVIRSVNANNKRFYENMDRAYYEKLCDVTKDEWRLWQRHFDELGIRSHKDPRLMSTVAVPEMPAQ